MLLIERLDDPISPRPHLSRAIDVIAVRVGVARKIEPLHRHALAIVRGSEQAVDHFLVGLWRIVREKRVQLGGRRRQAGEIEGHAAQ